MVPPADDRPRPESDVTRLLKRRAEGDAGTSEALLALVYEDLREIAARHLAREREGHTLQATALLHEAWMRLEAREGDTFLNRKRYFALASGVMRQLLTDHARRRKAEKRGGKWVRTALVECAADQPLAPADLLALDEALTRLAEVDPELERVVELRFFGGLTGPEAAEALGLPLRTLERRHRAASAWLRRALGSEDDA